MDNHRLKTEPQPKPQTVYKNKHKIDHRFKFKPYNYIVLGEKGQKSLGSKVNVLTPKTQS